MAWCLTAPSHYLNQCWLITSEVLWHSPESNYTVSAQAPILYNKFENYTFKISATSPKGQWVKANETLLFYLVFPMKFHLNPWEYSYFLAGLGPVSSTSDHHGSESFPLPFLQPVTSCQKYRPRTVADPRHLHRNATQHTRKHLREIIRRTHALPGGRIRHQSEFYFLLLCWIHDHMISMWNYTVM